MWVQQGLKIQGQYAGQLCFYVWTNTSSDFKYIFKKHYLLKILKLKMLRSQFDKIYSRCVHWNYKILLRLITENL